MMPQGLKNAPVIFNRMVINLLRPFRSFAPSYIDDTRVHSRAEDSMSDVEAHPQHLNQVFQVMRDNVRQPEEVHLLRIRDTRARQLWHQERCPC